MLIHKVKQPNYNTELTLKTTESQDSKPLLSFRITRIYDNASLAVGMDKQQVKELIEVLKDWSKDEN